MPLLKTFEEYERLAGRTLEVDGEALICSALGLCGESGEYAEHIKKWRFQGHALEQESICYELGDVLCYLSLAARANGLSLEQVAIANIEKLSKRYPEGVFVVERSINRTE